VVVKDEIKRKIGIGSFKIGKKLTDNNFSATFLGVHIESGLLCGIKVYEKKVISEQGLEDQLISEIKIRLFMNHPNMVSLYTCFSDSLNIYLIEEPFPSSETLSE
jgi:aurora kinase